MAGPLDEVAGPAGDGEALSRAIETLTPQTLFEKLSKYRTTSVEGRPGVVFVGAQALIQAVTGTTRQNASLLWDHIKDAHPQLASSQELASPVCGFTCKFKFPGRGQGLTDVVDTTTALKIIMLLPGKTAAAFRLKAAVLVTRFLSGDLSLVGEVFEMNKLQAYLAENEPEHPLAAIRQTALAQGLADPKLSKLDCFETPPPGAVAEYWKVAVRERSSTVLAEEEAKRAICDAKRTTVEIEEEAKRTTIEAEEEAKRGLATAGLKLARSRMAAEQAAIVGSRKKQTALDRADESEARERELSSRKRLAELSGDTSKRARPAVAPPPAVPHDTPEAHQAPPGRAEFAAYRAAGIADDAVPKDQKQADAWYKRAFAIQLKNRPSSWNNNTTKLYDYNARDIYGERVAPELCAPPRRPCA